MPYFEKKPIKRSQLRLFLGQTYYKMKKYFYWWFSKNIYSKNINKEDLDYVLYHLNKLSKTNIYL